MAEHFDCSSRSMSQAGSLSSVMSTFPFSGHCASVGRVSLQAFRITEQLDGCGNGAESSDEQHADKTNGSLDNAETEKRSSDVGNGSVTCISSAYPHVATPNNGVADGAEVASKKSTAVEERGRGKRKRKPVSYSRYLESSSSEDEEYDPYQSNKKYPKNGTTSEKNGDDRTNGKYVKNSAGSMSSKRNNPCTSVETQRQFSQGFSHQHLSTPLSLLASTSMKNREPASHPVHAGSSGSRTEIVSLGACEKQPLKPNREKELELEVTNENGEVEIVTIVDLHSSSDEGELLAMNGEDDIIPLSDNESCSASLDHDNLQDESEMNAMPGLMTDAAVGGAMLQPSVHIPDQNGLKETSHLDLQNDSFGSKQLANKKPVSLKKKKRKKARAGDEFAEFGTDAEDNDKVSRLKKLYGVQKQTKISKSSHVPSSAEKTTTSSSSLGPYLHVVGPKDAPITCRVVNVKDLDLDAPNKSKKNRLLQESSFVPSSLKLLDSVPWVCLFCGHGSAYSTLGDLFGPYHPQAVKSENMDQSHRTDNHSPALNKSSRSSRRHSNRLSTSSFESGNDGGAAGGCNLPAELWVHEACAVWTSGIYVAGGKLQGIEEAASIAAQMTCTGCNKVGATLGCYVKGCSQNYHYLCAVKAGCFFEEENFSVLCPKHREKSKKPKTAGPSE